jgi:SAM-dependent methyltransferase
MINYDAFAKFYDAVMGDRSKTVKRIEALIKINAPKAKTLLELACGTGALLKPLAKRYGVSGLDLSKEMLKVARKEVPRGKFFYGDMARFNLHRKFDVVLCVFDSVNHLMKFSQWESLFKNASEHLSPDGVFIFDVNTESKLARHSLERTWVRKFDGSYMLMKVQDLGKGIFNWKVEIFERQKGNQYKLWTENIKEVSFPVKRIMTALSYNFSSVKVFDPDRRHPSKNSDRLYFICKK